MENAERELWREQLSLREYNITAEQESKVIDWLTKWTEDSWDMLSDLIAAAIKEIKEDAQ